MEAPIIALNDEYSRNKDLETIQILQRNADHRYYTTLVEEAKAQQWQLDQEHATTLEGQIESLQADIARVEKQYEDSEKFLNREAAFEEQRLHEEVNYWKDKNYRLGG